MRMVSHIFSFFDDWLKKGFLCASELKFELEEIHESVALYLFYF